MPQIKIIVMQRGWVFVGRPKENGERVDVTDAICIRSWGTTKGLGDLINGPKEKTILDYYGTLGCHVNSIVYYMNVNQDAWIEVLSRYN